MELKKVSSWKTDGRPWLWQRRAPGFCTSLKADGRPDHQHPPEHQRQQQQQQQKQQGKRMQHHEKHTAPFFREFARSLQAKARRPVTGLPSPVPLSQTPILPGSGGGGQLKPKAPCHAASPKQAAGMVPSKSFSPVKGEQSKRDKGFLRQLHSRFCRFFPDVLTFCDVEFGDRGYGSANGSKVKPDQQGAKGKSTVSSGGEVDSCGVQPDAANRDCREPVSVDDRSVDRAAVKPRKDGKGCEHERKKRDDDSADETSGHVSLSEDQEDGETTEGAESSCEGVLSQGGEKSMDPSRLCPVCGGSGDGMEDGHEQKKCSHWMMMRKMEAIAMQVVLDAAMYQMTQCTQRTAELEEESCVQQMLLRSALRRQAEVTQEAEQKNAQVMGLMCELEASQQAWVAADDERRKLEALLAESNSKNQQLMEELSRQKAEISRLSEGMEQFLVQEKTIRRLSLSLEEARMEVSSLRSLLGYQSGKTESASSAFRGNLHSQSSESMRSPFHAKGDISRTRSDPEVLGRRDKKRSVWKRYMKSEDMSESITYESESKLWQAAMASPRQRETSTDQPSTDEGSTDCSENGSEGAVTQPIKAVHRIESTDFEDMRTENERLKMENSRLVQECDKTRRLLEVSQLRTKGNVAFNRMEFEDAYENYTLALQLEVDDKQLNALLYCNRAAASSALGNHMDALADCIAAISLDEQCTRAYSRRADVYIAIWDYEGALKDLLVVLERGGECVQEVEEKITAVRRRLRKHSGELDYYAVLALTSSCSATEIKAAYRKLALKYHPDKGGSHMEASFKFISRAYKVLSDPTQRYKYDSSVGRDKHLHRVRTVIP